TGFDGVETIEEPVEVARRTLAAGFVRQTIHRFVGGAERAGRVVAFVVIAKRLVRTPFHAGANKLRQLTLVVIRPGRRRRRIHPRLLGIDPRECNRTPRARAGTARMRTPRHIGKSQRAGKKSRYRDVRSERAGLTSPRTGVVRPASDRTFSPPRSKTTTSL